MALRKVTVFFTLMATFAAALPQYEAPGPVISTGGGGGYSGGGSDGGDSGIPASYSFSYDNSDPDSGNYYGHAEQREGESSEGEYRVLLPDGRTQIVKYKVDGTDGYRAQVSYEQPSGGVVIASNAGGGGGGGYQ